MAKYQLLDIALKQAFANNGLTQRVPYQLSPKDDDLNWLEGFTDAFQRPVLPQADAGNANGRYIKMGQLNQVLQNLSQAILNVKQGLDNVQGTIDDDVSIKIENIITEADKVLNNRVVNWLQTINNQNCAGLKNFNAININNFKTKNNAVANLEWCNGLPIVTFYKNYKTDYNINFTMTAKGVSVFTLMKEAYHYSYTRINNRNVTVSDSAIAYHFGRNLPQNGICIMSKNDILSYFLQSDNSFARATFFLYGV